MGWNPLMFALCFIGIPWCLPMAKWCTRYHQIGQIWQTHWLDAVSMLCQWLKQETVLVAAYVLTNVAYLYNRTFGAPRWRADFFRGFLKWFKRGKCHGCYRSCLIRAARAQEVHWNRGDLTIFCKAATLFFTFPSIWRFWRPWHKFIKPSVGECPQVFWDVFFLNLLLPTCWFINIWV